MTHSPLKLRLLPFACGLTLLLGSCGAFRSDVDSSNPVVAAQAQRVQDLENQKREQERAVDTEKAKLKSIEYQLKSAEQELKARKIEVK
jgi:purine-nucleoside phosphorylase